MAVTRLPARRLAGLLAAGVLFALTGAVGVQAVDPPRARAASPAASPTTGLARATRGLQGPVTVVVSKMTPVTAKPGSRLRVSGRLVNDGNQGVRQVSVRLLANPQRVGSRSELALASKPGAGLSRAGSPVPGSEHRVTARLDAGQSTGFSLSVPVDRMGFSRFGVYVVGLDVQGLTSAGQGSVGSATTFLPWTPKPSFLKPTRLALLWPLVAAPRRDANGIYTDDGLATQLAPGGRLRNLLDTGAGSTVTWVVDPALLQSVKDMSTGYRVRVDHGTVPGVGTADAKQWLSDARATLAGQDVLTLPYADPDLVALQRRGPEQDLTLATTTGPATASGILGRSVTGDVVWPPGGRVDQPTLEALRVAGARGVILDGAARPSDPSLSYTPTGRARLTTIGGSMQAGLADGTLSSLLDAPTGDDGAPVLARQRFLAQVAMITAERPGDPRTVLAAPPRRWSPDPSYAASLLSALRSAPWVKPVTLHDLMATPVPDVHRGPLTYGAKARRAELPADYLDDVGAMRRDLERFASILAPRGGEATAPFDLAILRTESSAWRADRARGTALRDRVDADLRDRRHKVYIAADRLVTLTSKSGKFPITVANDLDQAVDVRLDLTSRQQARLSVGKPRETRISAGRKSTIEVPAEARANGVVYVDAQLRTPDGEPYGQPVAIAVRATDYGTIAYVITGGAVVVLFGAAGIRLGRRARSARHRARQQREAG